MTYNFIFPQIQVNSYRFVGNIANLCWKILLSFLFNTMYMGICKLKRIASLKSFLIKFCFRFKIVDWYYTRITFTSGIFKAETEQSICSLHSVNIIDFR